MNGLKTGIPIILVIIAVAVLLISSTTQDEETYQNTTPGIEELLDKVRDTKIQNEQSDNPFVPITPEWTNASGPFVIDNDEYWLGQKIFVNISGIDENDKGKINVYMPVANEKFSILYSSIGFDGSMGRNNYYFTPSLSAINQICHSDQLLGEWTMRFEGTEYRDITFTIINEKIPGFEPNFETLKDVGGC